MYIVDGNILGEYNFKYCTHFGHNNIIEYENQGFMEGTCLVM